MNEEFKKKYLKYKIKCLELIGGEGEEKELTPMEKGDLDIIALYNYLLLLGNEGLTTEYSGNFATFRSELFNSHGELKIQNGNYRKFLSLLKINELLNTSPTTYDEQADIDFLKKLAASINRSNLRFVKIENLMDTYKYRGLKEPQKNYILHKIKKLIEEHHREDKELLAKFNNEYIQPSDIEVDIKSHSIEDINAKLRESISEKKNIN